MSYTIALDDPIGPLGDEFCTLGQAVDIARALERAGHTIRSIERGSEILVGRELHAVLGKNKPSAFENFPRDG
jgi:hypothetical protein